MLTVILNPLEVRLAKLIWHPVEDDGLPGEQRGDLVLEAPSLVRGDAAPRSSCAKEEGV